MDGGLRMLEKAKAVRHRNGIRWDGHECPSHKENRLKHDDMILWICLQKKTKAT